MNDVERVEPLFCIGESHCLRFRDRLARHPSLPRALHARTHFLMHIEAANFRDAGGLHADLAAALVATGLCVERPQDDGAMDLEAAHRATTFAERVLAARHAALADDPLVAPALLLFAGDRDCHSLAMRIGPGVDFELPDDPGYGRVEGAARVPFAAVEAAVTSRLQPFVDGLQLLRAAGFTRTMVHGLMPRTRDDERAARWCHGVRVAGAVRSKVAVVANRILARECRRLAVGFVDVWQALQQDGFLATGFDLDGVHANDAATSATFADVARCLRGVSRGDLNPAQYELLAELAGTTCDSGRGFWVYPAERLGVPVPPTADPDAVHAAVLAPAVRAALASGSAFDVGACLVHRRRASPAAAPVGVRRAWWSRRAATVRVTARAGGAATDVALPSGALLVFEPQSVDVTAAHGADDDGILVLGLLPRLPDETPSVAVVDGSEWPADPFRIEVAAAAARAPCRGGVWRRWAEVAGRTVVLEVPCAAPAEPSVVGSAP